MKTETKFILIIMVVALMSLLFAGVKESKEQVYVPINNQTDCGNAYDVQLKLIRDGVETPAEAASLLRELGCSNTASYVEMNYNLTASTQNESGTKQDNPDDNLTNNKPTTRRRLNSNGYSQRYVELEGETREDRITSLLTQYGFEPDTWYTIRTIAREHRVYPEMIVCIAYADSSLGRFLKTEHNYGNVGNNDRGDTQSYTSIEEGFGAIAKVLNNRYLGNYTTVNQLSRYGNAEGTIYASSPENWHINVTNCLGMIYNKYIPDDWNYRF